MTRKQIKPVYAVLGAALLAILVTPLAFAGAADGPQASSSASVRQQVKKLKTRIAALEANGDTRPSGPAGGDLAGTYPNPTIDQNAVGSNEVTDNTLTGADIEGSSIGASDMALDSVGSLALTADSVGSSELKGVSAVPGAGVGIAANGSNSAAVTCPAGQMVIGGGFAWAQNEAGTSIIDSAPSEGDPNGTWIVTGRTGNSDNVLFAWANCLAV